MLKSPCKKLFQKEQTLTSQKHMPLRRSTREKRNKIQYEYIVFIQEHEVAIGMVDDDSINFRQAMES
jgi:hypothetical protein